MAMIKLHGKTKLTSKTVFNGGPTIDPDVTAYIAAVEAADGQVLEETVKTAYTNFITGCKEDGIWSALKASCILAGARTLNGALVPLIGTAPTNNNFVSADYNRKTGLIGNGTTKYLNSNRLADSDGQNDAHISMYQSATSVVGVRNPFGYYKSTSPISVSLLTIAGTTIYPRVNNNTLNMGTYSGGNVIGLIGATRSNSSSYSFKSGTGAVTNISVPSIAPASLNHFVFAYNGGGASLSQVYNGRLSFYSIGSNINLTALSTRVSALMASINAAI